MSETREIEFTEYVLPDGRRAQRAIPVSLEAAEKADRIIAAGLFFECERLRTGHVSVTIADREEEVDVAIKLVPPTQHVRGAVEAMIAEFDLEGYSR